MARQVLSDGRGWFDDQKATHFAEDTWWNGNNHISKPTGSQWEHESIYRTAGGRWVRHWWSQRQGYGESWELIDEEDAIRWLMSNGHAEWDSLDKLDPATRARVEAALAEMEL